MAAGVKSRVEQPELVEKRRGQIVAAAIELFGRHGYHPTTIRDIATRANVSIGLIYQYVEDKEDVLYLALIAVLDAYKREIPTALDGIDHPLERFCAAARAYTYVIDANTQSIELAYRETKSLRRERRATIKQLESETNELIAACIRDCMAADLMTYQIVMLAHTWALKSWHFGPRMSLETYLDDGLDILLNSVLTPQGKRGFKRLTDNK